MTTAELIRPVLQRAALAAVIPGWHVPVSVRLAVAEDQIRRLTAPVVPVAADLGHRDGSQPISEEKEQWDTAK